MTYCSLFSRELDLVAQQHKQKYERMYLVELGQLGIVILPLNRFSALWHMPGHKARTL